MSESEHHGSSSRGAADGKRQPPTKPGLKTRAFHLLHLASRPMTLGVRAAAFDAAGRVFLLRHTYVRGWQFPGGGVDPAETAEEALRREFREEGNVEFGEAPTLLGVYFNRAASRRDHVLFYLGRAARQVAPKVPDWEIAEAGFFALDALPQDTTPATRRRLAEIAGAPVEPDW